MKNLSNNREAAVAQVKTLFKDLNALEKKKKTLQKKAEIFRKHAKEIMSEEIKAQAVAKKINIFKRQSGILPKNAEEFKLIEQHKAEHLIMLSNIEMIRKVIKEHQTKGCFNKQQEECKEAIVEKKKQIHDHEKYLCGFSLM